MAHRFPVIFDPPFTGTSLFAPNQYFIFLIRASLGRIAPTRAALAQPHSIQIAPIFNMFRHVWVLASHMLMKSIEVALTQHDKDLDHGVIKQVLSYFVRNPRTADTLEGIARWRLLEERVQKSLRETEAAIDWLVEQEYLKEVTVAGSKEVIFRLNPERHSDAIRLLAKSKAGRVRKTG